MQYITAINEAWRVEKSKKSINVEGGKNIKINKRVSTFIREMRVDLNLCLGFDSNDSHNFVVCFSKSNLNSLLFFSLTKNMRTTKKIWMIQKPLKVFRKLNPRLRNPNPKLRKLMTLRTPLLMMGRTNLSLILTLRFVSFLLHKVNIHKYSEKATNFCEILHRRFVLCGLLRIYELYFTKLICYL